MNSATTIPGTLSLKLIAQTPMIHFQYNHDGATLRATEVKPKLDKFLISKKGDIPKSWLIGKTQALNYKLRILGDVNYTILDRDEEKKHKFYFGNMGSSAEKKFLKRNASLTIICNNASLLNFIEDNIKEFFILTNFGARQSKGYGAFLVDGTTDDDIKTAVANADTVNFGFTCPFENDPFDMAYVVYSVMKTGINNARFDPMVRGEFNPAEGRYRNKGAYVKSFALRQFLPSEVGGDKAFVKSRALPLLSKRRNPRTDPGEKSAEYKQFVFIRALLGLAGYLEFNDDLRCNLNERKTIEKRRAVYYKNRVEILNFDNARIDNGKYIVSADEIRKGSGIKRFKSPITIKIFGSRVIFMLNDSYNELLDKIFVFLKPENPKWDNTYTKAMASKDYVAAANAIKNHPWIKTPKSFDADDFVTRFVTYFNDEAKRLNDAEKLQGLRGNPLSAFKNTLLEEVK